MTKRGFLKLTLCAFGVPVLFSAIFYVGREVNQNRRNVTISRIETEIWDAQHEVTQRLNDQLRARFVALESNPKDPFVSREENKRFRFAFDRKPYDETEVKERFANHESAFHAKVLVIGDNEIVGLVPKRIVGCQDLPDNPFDPNNKYDDCQSAQEIMDALKLQFTEMQQAIAQAKATGEQVSLISLGVEGNVFARNFASTLTKLKKKDLEP